MDSATEPIDAELAEVMPGSAPVREVGQDLPDGRAEFEAMPGDARRNAGGRARQPIDHEVLVRRIAEHAHVERLDSPDSARQPLLREVPEDALIFG